MLNLLRISGIRLRDAAAAVSLSTLTALSAFTLTVLSGWLITRAFEMPPILDLGVAITAVRALGISKAVFRYTDRLVSHRVSLTAEARLRLTQFDAATHGAQRGHATQVDQDIKKVTESFVRATVPICTAAIMSAIALIALGILLPAGTVILAAAFVVTGIIAPWLAVRAARSGTRVTSQAEMLDSLDQCLNNRAEFALSGQDEHLLHTLRESSRTHERTLLRAARPLVWNAFLGTLAQGLAVFAILWLAVSTYTGEPPWLGMVIFIPLVAFETHAALEEAAVELAEARLVASTLALPTDKTEASSPSQERATAPGEILAEDLRCAYGSGPWNFHVPAGGRLVIRGPSGCGKSTLLRTLAGELHPVSGGMALGGEARYHAEDEWVFATSIRENLALARPQATNAEIETVATAVGLELDLDLELADGAASLSSGQRRRLLLARALLTDSEILLLDEPTEHISREDARGLMDLLLRPQLAGVREERTLVIVTHSAAAISEQAGVSVIDLGDPAQPGGARPTRD